MDDRFSDVNISPSVLLLEDDYHFAKWALAELAEELPSFEVVVATNLSQARQWLEQPASSRLQMAVIDLHLGKESGIDLIGELASSRPNVAIMVVTAVETSEDALQAIRAGAQGYLLKIAIAGEFRRAIRQLIEGGSPINPGIAFALLSEFRTAKSPASSDPDRDWDKTKHAELLMTLSPRESEVLRLLTRGYADKEVAGLLKIAPSTVDTHIRAIYRKFQINSRAQLRKMLHS